MDKELLMRIKAYIEKTEEIIDGEWGTSRNVKELLRDKEMPELYYEVLALLNE